MDFETFIRRLSINFPSMSVDQAVVIFDAVFPAGDPTLEALRKRLTSTDDDNYNDHVANFMSWLNYSPRDYKIKAIKDLRAHMQGLGFSGDDVSLKRIKDAVEAYLEDYPYAFWPSENPYA